MEKDNINREAQFDLLPVTKGDRTYRFWDYTVVITGFAVATWCFLIGGSLALYVGFKTAIIASIAGNMVSVILMITATTIQSAKYGIDGFNASGTLLGKKGTKAYLIFVSIIMVSWIMVLCTMITRSVLNILSGALDLEISNRAVIFIISLVVALICWVIAWKGPQLMKVMNSFVTPIFILIMIGLIFIMSKDIGWGNIADAKPLAPFESDWLNFLLAFELSLGAGFSWWPNMGGLARICKTTRTAFWPNIIGLVFAATLGTALGTAAALVIGDSDPTSWMIPLGGAVIGVIALLLLCFANIAANSVMIYNLSIGLKQVKFFFTKSWGTVTGMVMIPAVIGLIWADALYDRFYIILGVACLIYAPIVMMQLVDYFVFRRQTISLRSLYDETESSKYYFWKGYNWVAIIVFIASIALYFVFLDPFALVPTKLFPYCTATGAVSIFAAAMYYILGKIFLVGGNVGGYGSENIENNK